MSELDPKYQIIDLPNGHAITFRVLHAELSEKSIRVGTPRVPTLKPALGLEVERLDGNQGHHFYAITAKGAIAWLWPQLSDPATATQPIVMRRFGPKFGGHFSFEHN